MCETWRWREESEKKELQCISERVLKEVRLCQVNDGAAISSVSQQYLWRCNHRAEEQNPGSEPLMHGARGPHQPAWETDVDNIILWHGYKKKEERFWTDIRRTFQKKHLWTITDVSTLYFSVFLSTIACCHIDIYQHLFTAKWLLLVKQEEKKGKQEGERWICEN